MMLRRRLLQHALAALAVLSNASLRAARLVAVRLWPAPDYTRVTLESDQALRAQHQLVEAPPRLAVDIEGLDWDPALKEMVRNVDANDPTLAGVRVAQFAPGIVRLVLDLKQPVTAQVFSLEPVAAYRHRLVFDLTPTDAPDPLAALIAERLRERAQTQPADPLGDWLATRTVPRPKPASSASSATFSVARRASSTGAGGQSGTQSSTERLIIIALDPGHGGEDPGAIGPTGTREKDVVLRLARLLRERINAASVQGNPLRAYLTRDADFFVPLQTRVDKARRVQADLFISLHADAFYTPHPQGASVFALSDGAASSNAARWLADKENRADRVGGLNLRTRDQQVRRALLDMSTTAQIKDSLQLGHAMLGPLGQVGKLHRGKVEQAGFAVLKAPDIPSVLVEAAFISNPDEEARLNDTDYLEQLADALMRGLAGYFARHPPLARQRSL